LELNSDWHRRCATCDPDLVFVAVNARNRREAEVVEAGILVNDRPSNGFGIGALIKFEIELLWNQTCTVLLLHYEILRVVRLESMLDVG